MTGIEIVQLIQIAVRLATDIGIDVAEFRSSLDENGELPEEKRKEYIRRARNAVEKL